MDNRTRVVTALDAGLITTTTPSRRVRPSVLETARALLDAGFMPSQVQEMVRDLYPPCSCGHRDTHLPDPGIGCTAPACLCLEPAEPAPRPPSPPDRSWIQMERIR